MKYSFHPEVEDEFNEAITYYEDCSVGLGLDLSLEVFCPFRMWLIIPLCGRRSM
jgi:hypothetical protein